MSEPLTFAPGVAYVSLAAPVGRLVLRTRDPAAHGLDLPTRIGQRSGGDVQILMLGPDEWAIQAADISAILAARPAHPHSLVDVSGREVTLLIDGPRAAELLTLGCARDIDAIPVGEGRRTICDGVTVVLWRDAAHRFRLDVWHSFVPHLLHLFIVGCKELAAEPV